MPSESERYGQIEVSVVMPCLNEEQTLGVCIDKIRRFFQHACIKGEIIVADNGSTDRSVEIAGEKDARVVSVEEKGYGNALRGGIEEAAGKYIIMGDADDSYDFLHLEGFINKLREGYDLVMGNRFKGGIRPGAMPALHRYLGNPLLSFIGRVFFRVKVGDFHCGLRGFTRDAYRKMYLKSEGMEFASEMVIKASLSGLRITEVPTVLSPDGRNRKPHLRSWHDGWRHLKLLLIFCPRWLFLYPGIILFFSSLLCLFLLLPVPREVGGVRFDIHTLFYMGVLCTAALILMQFYLFTRIYGDRLGYYRLSDFHRLFLRFYTIEKGILFGGLLLAGGVIGTVLALHGWQEVNYSDLRPEHMFRLVMPSGFAIIYGMLIILGSFFIRILRMK